MAYKQSNNPISRKTSPLRDKGNHPHPHKNEPGIISEDKLDLTSGSTSMHDGEKPSPKLVSGDMSFEPHDKDYENYPKPWDGPDYEDPDWKPGVSRKAHKGSPAKFHEPKGAPEGDRVSHKTGKTKKQIIKEKNARSQMPHPSQQDRSLNKKLNK